MKRFLLAVMSCALTLCIVGTYSQASALLVNTASFVARLTMIIPTEDDRFVEAAPATTNPERGYFETTALTLNADGTAVPYTLSTSKTIKLNVDATAFVTVTSTPGATESDPVTTSASYTAVNDEAVTAIRGALSQIKANDQTALINVDYGNVPNSSEETAFYGEWHTKLAQVISDYSSTINFVKIGAHPALDLTSSGTSTPYIVDASDALSGINATSTNNYTFADNVLLSPDVVSALQADTATFVGANKYDYINDHLGYRLVLKDALAKSVTADADDSAKQVVSEKFTTDNNNINLRFMIHNTGWASVLKAKKADVVVTTSAGTIVHEAEGLQATPAPAAEAATEPSAQSDVTPTETTTTSGTTPTTPSVPATAVTPLDTLESVVDVKEIAPGDFKIYDVMLKDVNLPYNDTYKVYLRISSGETLGDGSYYSAISFANPDTYNESLQANLLTTIDVPVEETPTGEPQAPVHEYETFAVYSEGTAADGTTPDNTLKFYKRKVADLVAPPASSSLSTDNPAATENTDSPTDGTPTTEPSSPTGGTPTSDDSSPTDGTPSTEPNGTELSPLGRQFMTLLEAQSGGGESATSPAPADNTTTASGTPTTPSDDTTTADGSTPAAPEWLPLAGATFDGRTVTAAYAIDLGAAFSDPSDIGYPEAKDVPWYDVRQNISSIQVVDEGITPINMNFWFSGMSNLENVDVALLDTSKCVSMSEVFNGCSKIAELNLGSWNTRYVYNMSKMFADCTNLVTIWVSDKWDTERVNLFGGYGVFYNCNKLVGQFGFKRGDTSGLDLVNDIKFACIDTAPPATDTSGTTGSAGMGAGTAPQVQRGFLTHIGAPAYTPPAETTSADDTSSSDNNASSGENTNTQAQATENNSNNETIPDSSESNSGETTTPTNRVTEPEMPAYDTTQRENLSPIA